MSVELPPARHHHGTIQYSNGRNVFIFKLADLDLTLQHPICCCKPVGLLSVFPQLTVLDCGEMGRLELSDLLQNISQVPRVAPSMQCHVPRQIFPTRTCVTPVRSFKSITSLCISQSPGVRTENRNNNHHHSN